jgi:DNA-binding NarL/FixJ family response regulator
MLTKVCVQVAVMHLNPVMAVGLEAAFGQAPEFRVTRTAAMSAGALGRECVIVADYQTALGVAAACENLGGEAAPRLLVMASASRGWQVRHALQNGVHGYVSSECEVRELHHAVRRLSNGERYLCALASQCIAESFSQQPLTPRELNVLKLVERGLDNKTISKRLGIALGTVKAHLRTLLDKLDAGSRTEAVSEAIRRGFIGAEVGAD